jgi:hypothetical protein
MLDRLPGLRDEALLKCRGRIVAGDDEQVMKSRDHFFRGPSIDALIERMEQIGFECREAGQKQAPLHIRSACAARTQQRSAQLFRAVAMQKLIFGMRCREAVQQFARVDRDSGGTWIYAIGGIKRDSQASSLHAILLQLAIESGSADIQHVRGELTVALSYVKGM